MSATPPVGTWIRSLVPVSDSGDFNEREAPAGALGRVEDTRPAGPGREASCTVVFYPSFVTNEWSASEIEGEAEVLAAADRDIPSREALEFTSAVADLVADGDVDEDERTVYARDSVAARIRDNAHATFDDEPEVLAILRAGETGDGLALDFDAFDRLASIAGIGDRAPSPAYAHAR